jgi:hypothetical protein
MKFIHIFINEFKTKWSTKLLMGVFALVVSSIFASNLILKNEYDMMKNKPKDYFSRYQKMLNEPFKYIVADNGKIIDKIYFENSNQYTVFMEKQEDMSLWVENIFIKNDTLFLKFSDADKNKIKSNPKFQKPFLHILAPHIESINLVNTEIFIRDFQQKSLNINLLDKSRCTMGRANPIDFCKISLSDYSDFIVDLPIDLKVINLKSIEVNMQKNSSLQLKKAQIEQLKLNATDENIIELSSEMFMKLMKK